MSRYDGRTSPSGIAKGVAAVIPSVKGATYTVIREEKEAVRNSLAAAAGLNMFCPIPPKSILIITIATNAPITLKIIEDFNGGIFNARINPVTTQERSVSVCLFFAIILKRYSNSTHDDTEVTIIRAATYEK
jgi:hypothetical protein